MSLKSKLIRLSIVLLGAAFLSAVAIAGTINGILSTMGKQ